MAVQLSTVLQQARTIHDALDTVRDMYPELSTIQTKMVPPHNSHERFPTRSPMVDLINLAKTIVDSSFFNSNKKEKKEVLTRIETQFRPFRLFEDGALLSAPVNQFTDEHGRLSYFDPVGTISKSGLAPFVHSHGSFHDRFAISLMRLKHELFLGWRDSSVNQIILQGMDALDQILYDPQSNPVSSENMPISPLMGDSIKSTLNGLEVDFQEWKEEFFPEDELLMLKSVFLTPEEVDFHLASMRDVSLEAFTSEFEEMQAMDRSVHELNQALLKENSFVNSYSRLLSMGPLAEAANKQILIKIKVLNTMVQELTPLFESSSKKEKDCIEKITYHLQNYANVLRHTLTPLSSEEYMKIQPMSAELKTKLNSAYNSFRKLIDTWPSLLRACEADSEADQESIRSCQASMKFRFLASKATSAVYVSERVVKEPFDLWSNFNGPALRDADARCVETDLYKRSVFIIEHFMVPKQHVNRHRAHAPERIQIEPEEPQSPPLLKPVPKLIHEEPSMRPPPRSPELEREPVAVEPVVDSTVRVRHMHRESSCLIPTALSFDGSLLTKAMVCSGPVDYRDELNRGVSVETGYSIPQQQLEDEKSSFAVAFAPHCRYRNRAVEHIVEQFESTRDKQTLVRDWVKFVQGKPTGELSEGEKADWLAFVNNPHIEVLRNPVNPIDPKQETVIEPFGKLPVFVNRQTLNALIAHPVRRNVVPLLGPFRRDEYLTISERQYQEYTAVHGNSFASSCPLRIDKPAADPRKRPRLLVNQNIQKLIDQLKKCKLEEVDGDYQSCLCL
eukprot:GILJ01001147.1.p1 GENE.GILJ01001147.1~~GILJ01001147.1.p1  ORF type:complete len:827 (-),score=146.32 GILJ01001147.1:127-2493(-)